jgi:hypothetical protein
MIIHSDFSMHLEIGQSMDEEVVLTKNEQMGRVQIDHQNVRLKDDLCSWLIRLQTPHYQSLIIIVKLFTYCYKHYQVLLV